MSFHQNRVSDSAIYRGRIRHRRYVPVSHEFDYEITMVMLDLDFLESELSMFPVLGSKLPSIGWFRLKDYVGERESCLDLKSYVLGKVKAQLGYAPEGKVLLLTHLRYWGFMMNPLAVFYCYDKNGSLHSVALQVTNTPWNEKTLYIIQANNSSPKSESRFKKAMHVSPFNPMDMEYVCKFVRPGKNLVFHLENHSKSIRHTDATIVFKRKKYSRSQLMLLALAQPAMTIKVGFGIYWQALKLWKLKSPFYNHPQAEEVPHSTSTQPVNQ